MIETKYRFTPAQQAEFETFLQVHCKPWKADDRRRFYIISDKHLRDYLRIDEMPAHEAARALAILKGSSFDVARKEFCGGHWKQSDRVSSIIIEAICDRAGDRPTQAAKPEPVVVRRAGESKAVPVEPPPAKTAPAKRKPSASSSPKIGAVLKQMLDDRRRQKREKRQALFDEIRKHIPTINALRGQGCKIIDIHATLEASGIDVGGYETFIKRLEMTEGYEKQPRRAAREV